MLAIVVPTILATFAFAWWFRASNTRARYLPDWAFSGADRARGLVDPGMVIILLGGVAWIGSHDLDPARPLSERKARSRSRSYRSTGSGCSSTRERGVASVNQLVVPAGVPLRFSLTSASVWNAFFVPQLGSMIYTMNGMRTQLNLQADEPGRFTACRRTSAATASRTCTSRSARCAATSSPPGPGHARPGRALDAARLHGARAAEHERPASTYGAVQAGLFAKVVSQELPPAPGDRSAGGQRDQGED